MVYAKKGPFTDGSTTPPINAALLNGLETAVTDLTTYQAPAPSGGDDTAAIQALLTAAQTNGGRVQLQAGTYKVNLATAQSFIQPQLVGRGKGYTYLTPANTNQAILRMQGGSGGNSGGYIADLTFTNSGSTAGVAGLELADVCDVHWDRISFSGNLAEGIRFHITQSAGFCEFNHGDATFDSTIGYSLRYMTDNAYQSSFHGSGLTGGIINLGNTGPAIQIDNYAFPYNAPMNVTIFPHSAVGAIFRNFYTSGRPGFFGALKIENQSNGQISVGDTGWGDVFHAGTVTVLTNQVKLGRLWAVRRIYWPSGGFYAQYEPFQWNLPLTSGSTGFDLRLQNGEAAWVNVNITASGYAATYQLMCWQNPFNPGGTVTTVAGAVYSNGSGAGAPTFGISNYQLTITNSNYSSAYTANVSINHLGGSIGADGLQQL